MAAKQVSDKYKSKRSGILYIITGLVVAVFIVFGLVISLVFVSSQDKLIEKSKDKIIQSEVENITSATGYITDLLMPVFNQKAQEMSVSEMLEALTTGKLSDAQKWMNNEMSKEVANQVMGLDKIIAVMTYSPLTGTRPVILAASEAGLLKWEVPEYMLDAMDEDKGYVLMENGVPELGLEGEQLIVIKKTEDKARGITAYFVGTTSLQDSVDEINSFFNTEKSRTIILITLVMIISILVIVLITFFVLSYLLRKRITEPINELSAAAEEVMEGNLDVEVTVRKGEELEKLKTVFNEMVRSIRDVINKAVGI
jgi:nitrogen fixation/metabolism regulation signal transduction histidine kinase